MINIMINYKRSIFVAQQSKLQNVTFNNVDSEYFKSDIEVSLSQVRNQNWFQQSAQSGLCNQSNPF